LCDDHTASTLVSATMGMWVMLATMSGLTSGSMSSLISRHSGRWKQAGMRLGEAVPQPT